MKIIFYKILYFMGITRFAAWWNRNKVLILCYHGVTKRIEKDELDLHGLHVRSARFDSHLQYLQKKYNFISLSGYISARITGQKLAPYSVVLTFDDGYRNLLTVTAPSLGKHNIPACFFIITDKISGKFAAEENANNQWTPGDDKKLLSWADLNALKKHRNIEFGSHTCSHPQLALLEPDEIERELTDSFALIHNNFAQSVPLSYPKGIYTKSIADKAHSIGYICALTTDQGANDSDTDLFTLKRTMIGDNDDKASFAVRVSGLREWLVKLKSVIFPYRYSKNKQQLKNSLVERFNDSII